VCSDHADGLPARSTIDLAVLCGDVVRIVEHMPKAIRKLKTEVKRQTVTGRVLTPRQKKELAALAAVPDDHIDTSDIPELPPNAWKDAVRGRFYRPLKQAISMRLDADEVAWLKKRGKGYQTRANNILRRRMLDESKRA
jgi:uncharacterized protein (DUF4415 family)